MENKAKVNEFLKKKAERTERLRASYDNTKTLANALQQIEKLEAEKEDMLEMLEEILEGKKDGRTYISTEEIESLIQKMKQ